MNHIIAGIALCMLGIAIASCKESPLDPNDPVYRLKGNLFGRVYLVDYQASSSPSQVTTPDHGGTTVSIEGRSYKGVTDSTGRWTINDLPAGTYTISFSKPGFGTMKLFGQQFVGGGELYIGQTVLARCQRISPSRCAWIQSRDREQTHRLCLLPP